MIACLGILGSSYDGALPSTVSVGIKSSSALETRMTPMILAATAKRRIVLKRSMPNMLPSTSVKSPDRLLKIVTLLTDVCARAMLIVTLAANLFIHCEQTYYRLSLAASVHETDSPNRTEHEGNGRRLLDGQRR